MTKVKSITTYYSMDEDGNEKSKSLHEERNENGGILLHEEYFDESVQSKTERDFNAEDILIEERQYSFSDQPDRIIRFHYNESKKIEKIEEVFQDGSVTNRIYKRDLPSNITTIDIIDEEDYMEGKEIRKFDLKGRVLEETIFEEDSLKTKELIQYNDEGRVVERYTEDGDGYKNTYHYKYAFDEEGRISQLQILDEDQQLVRMDYMKYNEKGNQIEHIIQQKFEGWTLADQWEYNDKDLVTMYKRVRSNGELVQEVKNEYNAQDLLIKRETKDVNGSIYNFYEYELF